MDRNILLLLLAITALVVAVIWLNERRICNARRQGVPLEGFGGWFSVSHLIIPVLGVALWFTYSLRSVRVRNTFVR